MGLARLSAELDGSDSRSCLTFHRRHGDAMLSHFGFGFGKFICYIGILNWRFGLQALQKFLGKGFHEPHCFFVFVWHCCRTAGLSGLINGNSTLPDFLKEGGKKNRF